MFPIWILISRSGISSGSFLVVLQIHDDYALLSRLPWASCAFSASSRILKAGRSNFLNECCSMFWKFLLYWFRVGSFVFLTHLTCNGLDWYCQQGHSVVLFCMAGALWSSCALTLVGSAVLWPAQTQQKQMSRRAATGRLVYKDRWIHDHITTSARTAARKPSFVVNLPPGRMVVSSSFRVRHQVGVHSSLGWVQRIERSPFRAKLQKRRVASWSFGRDTRSQSLCLGVSCDMRSQSLHVLFYKLVDLQ